MSDEQTRIVRAPCEHGSKRAHDANDGTAYICSGGREIKEQAVPWCGPHDLPMLPDKPWCLEADIHWITVGRTGCRLQDPPKVWRER